MAAPHKRPWKGIIQNIEYRENPNRLTLVILVVGMHKDHGRQIELDFLSVDALEFRIQELQDALDLHGDYIPQHAQDVALG